MSLWLKWDITYRCNLFCQHCINGKYLDKESVDISVEEFIKIINNIKSTVKIDGISFLGGEPILHKDFIKILQFLDEENIKFNFNSNGLMLTKNNLENILCLKNLQNIVLSLDGPDKKTNDIIRGRSVYDMMVTRLNDINKYRTEHESCNAMVTINFVATSKNYNKVNDMIDFCLFHHVDRLTILEFIEDGNGIGKGLKTDESMVVDMVKTIANRYEDCKGRLDIEPKFVRPLAIDYAREVLGKDFPIIAHGCGVGTTFAFLNNKGYIFPCDRERNMNDDLEYRHNLLDKNFADIWKEKDFSEPFSRYYSDWLYENLEPCKTCRYLKDLCYPCHLLIDEKEKREMTMCKFFVNEIEKVTNNYAEK